MILNLKRSYICLDKKVDAEYIFQDGIIFNWSESNCCYESAWWLSSSGDPINESEHVRNLLNDRPFDKKWLTSPAWHSQ